MSDIKYLTKEELAKRWGVTTRTIENMVSRGDCPQPLRLGYKIVRWSELVIEVFEKKQSRK